MRTEQKQNHLEIEAQRNYRAVADSLVEEAKRYREGKREKGYEDDKIFTPPQNIVNLIASGAEIFGLNLPHIKGGYVHEVEYREHMFISISEELLVPIINYGNR